ncbi:hypothetical protein PF010_g2656 [Phytophthora fragariae]|uniref:NAD(P)-binding domain-containing protein n=1 Tax=Phytophthora fragariae TaxID=53985 RepID=A0A6G0LWG2_9STRA|nr:hypothetical protein PF010_g2656 [Phytophthora fragariae]
MMPSAKLTQGSFADMDVILADNFARAASRNGIKQIVYLSGILPPKTGYDKLSRHLRSRLEVERILSAYGVPVTTIRAGLIVGPEGSSFPILAKLVRRLPVMILPKWTRTQTHPIALSEVLEALKASIGNSAIAGQEIDVGGPDVMTYKEMMKQTADIMGKKRYFINIPLLTIRLSRLWVSLITQTPKEMAYPLIESLAHPMVARPVRMVKGIGDGGISFREAAAYALQEEKRKRKDSRSSGGKRLVKSALRSLKSDVRSVQRMTLPEGKDALWAARCYFAWLPSFAKPLLRTEIDERNNCRVYRLLSRKPLLELTYSERNSTPDCAVYAITGGSFARTGGDRYGRLEFLQIVGTSECVAAIHDYTPSLPWFLYKYTQAKLHLWVMYAFQKHLRRLIKQGEAKQLGKQENQAAGS